MNWEDLVLAGLDAVRRHEASQWELGDLAVQVEVHHGEHSLERYAGQIGVDFGLLKDYRRVAAAYQLSVRTNNCSWWAHRSLAARPNRLEWLAKAAEHHWSTRQLQEEIHLADNPPAPRDLPQRIQQQIDDGTPAAEAVTQAVRTYGPLPPSQARDVARITHMRVPGTDNRMYDDRPLEVVERDSDRVQRQMGLYQALKHIATKMQDPRDEVATIPSYQYAATTEYLDHAIQWLLEFRAEWRKVHD